MVGALPGRRAPAAPRSRRCWQRHPARGARVPRRGHAAPPPARRSRRRAGRARFVVIAEADGSAAEAAAVRGELARRSARARSRSTRRQRRPRSRRSGAGATASRSRSRAQRGGKVSEDIVVPLDRLARGDRGDARDRRPPRPARRAAGATPATATCTRRSSSPPATTRRAARAPSAAAHELFALAVALGGIVSGEHGLGLRQARPAAPPVAAAAPSSCTARSSALFDPKGLLNPGKKLP